MDSMIPNIRILLADDHKLVRSGLRLLITEMPDCEVVAEADNGQDAIAACETHHPDIVLLDIAMPVMNGLDALEQIRKTHPEVKTIMLSMLASEEHVIRALSLGANGYLLKDSAPSEMEQAIRSVLHGDVWLSPPISKQVVDGYLSRVTAPAQSANDMLSPRQLEVLKLIAEGKSTKEIAYLLNLSSKTIDTHRAQLMEKLGLQDIAGLVRYAIRHGLVSLDQ